MNLKRIFDQKLYLPVLSVMALCILVIASLQIFTTVRGLQNQKKIEQTKKFIESQPNSNTIKETRSLLSLGNLTEKQKFTLYNELVLRAFMENDMPLLLDTIGYAFFYTRIAEDTEQEVYLYSLMAHYYFSIGADMTTSRQSNVTSGTGKPQKNSISL